MRQQLQQGGPRAAAWRLSRVTKKGQHGATVLLLCATSACAAGEGQAPITGATLDSAADDSAGVVPLAPSTGCTTPDGAPSPPASVSDAVAFINALPKPVTLDCFLQALPRPIEMNATQSLFSAQPAAGLRSPRLFLFFDPLILSVVPDGVGSHLLEFGEVREQTRSLKAEIAFPVAAELGAEAPYERILFNADLTTCAFCHAQEEPAEDIALPGAFVSRALRPFPHERVSLSNVQAEAEACDAALEPERCAILAALFDQGAVFDRDFPGDFATF